MNNQEIELLAVAVAARIKPSIPIEVDLWDTDRIADYMKRTASYVRRVIVPEPSFPAPILLPSTGKPNHLYRASEVIAWAENRRQRKSV